MAETKALYYEDPYLTSFTATVLKTGQTGGKQAIVLNQTAFYPEGGGQPADHGWLAGVRVLDVRKEHGEIWHVLDREPEAGPGTEVEGEIDWDRRFDFMQQHHGQHLLSAAFEDVLGAKTVSVHMGEKICTLDIDRPELADEEVQAVLERANEMVWANAPVHARFVKNGELARLPLRNPPKVSGPVRIVSAGDFDHSPCGGTHPCRTGEVGMIVILRRERYKEKIRVEFVCGGRALKEFTRRNALLTQAAARLSTGFDELPAAIERIRKAEEEARKALVKAREQLAVQEAEALISRAPRLYGEIPLVCARLEGRPADDLRMMARCVAERGGVALLGTADGNAKLVFARADEPDVDMGALIREASALIGGKGGGKRDQAQGGGPDAGRLAEALEFARKRVEESAAHAEEKNPRTQPGYDS